MTINVTTNMTTNTTTNQVKSTLLKPNTMQTNAGALYKSHCAYQPHSTNLNNRVISTLLTASVLAFTVMGCQSRPPAAPTLKPIIASDNAANTQSITFATTTNPDEVTDSALLFLPSRLPAFNIQGKIGAVIPATDTQPKSSGSAFYAWDQDGDRFAIDLTGALGIGRTNISFDGQTATLSSERTGTLTADSPEALLATATGWHVPISQMPYWISGSPAPSDDSGTVDNYRRLIEAQNGDWAATFDYADNITASLPDKIKVLRADGHRLIMTITHNLPIANMADTMTSTTTTSEMINSSDKTEVTKDAINDAIDNRRIDDNERIEFTEPAPATTDDADADITPAPNNTSANPHNANLALANSIYDVDVINIANPF